MVSYSLIHFSFIMLK